MTKLERVGWFVLLFGIALRLSNVPLSSKALFILGAVLLLVRFILTLKSRQ